MALTDIKPVKKSGLIFGSDYVECSDKEATHWVIEIGFDGNSGVLVLPSRKCAEACMNSFVSPYELGEI